MKANIANQVEFIKPGDPAAYFDRHADELVMVGAAAFGQPVDSFAPQVKERFGRAGLAQVMRYGGQAVGFALYEMLHRERLWRRFVY